ncbi:hypothetical protein Glove_529g41 [Diversispora epigaea]|uniref:FACT complex subunit n=1 Tax=Diversispora epigaea TaxID=1348612 RepID=A0A397GDY9_9GLOM|nr:hypothetical protein Glove_529g41 [Diversispora epigaea]
MPEEKTETRLDAKTFHKRVRHFLNAWKTSSPTDSPFQGVNAILIIVSDISEENPYQKSTAFQQWILGYEFKDTIIVVMQDKIHFVVRERRAEVLEQLKQGDRQVPIEIHKLSKDVSNNHKVFESIISKITEGDQKKVGLLLKEKPSGKFYDEWLNVFDQHKDNLEEVDISSGIATALAVKDEEELRTIRTASKISITMMNRFINVVTTIVDDEKETTHDQLSDKIENILYSKDDKWLSSQKTLQDVDFERTDICYAPIIQSGGNYNFKATAQSDNNLLHDGTILCSLGVRYKSYCSNIGRTILIDPTKDQEKTYEFLLDLQRRLLEWIKDGVKISDVYKKALKYIKMKRPELVEKFVKNLGHGMGIEFRESNYILNLKNDKEFQAGMVLNLFTGFVDLENPKATDAKNKIYALWIIDTVRVSNESAVPFTEGNKNLDSICFSLKDANESEQETKKANKRPTKPVQAPRSAARKSTILKTKFRSEEKDEESIEQRRKRHQEELAAQKQADGLARFGNGVDHTTKQPQEAFRKFESYKRDTALPKEVKELKIIVDQRNESVILPVFGFAVPFHISTLKNVNKSEEGEYIYLRLNFLTPGQASGKKEDMPFDDPNANFIRAFTYRSTDPLLADIYKGILDLKKSAAKKEAERKEMADLIQQDKLIELKGRRPTHRLSDVFVRPGLEGKRVPGELEIHENGLRYHSHRTNQKLDILFSNIQHLFFQPCDNELIVLLHMHLKNPVIHGKKKTKDIQFYREASDVQFDETGNRKRKFRYGDEDELGAEQEERRRRTLLNKEFKAFAEKISESSEGSLDVDIPFRDIGFQGVPFRTNVLLQPTTECFVHLTDPPFLVVTITDIEIAHLERVQFGLKNFDLVFIFKDYSRSPLHINTIPMNQLENVKDWLDSVDVTFYEGTQNLNWSQIMKTINQDPADFYSQGGWSFLKLHSENDDSDDASDSASEYQQSEDEFEESSSNESSYDDEVSDNAVVQGSETEESDDSAPDWDELEEKARRADERKHGTKRATDSDEELEKNKRVRR